MRAFIRLRGCVMNNYLDRDDLLLIGDGALITCGVSAMAMAVVLLLSEVLSAQSEVPVWLQTVSSTAFFGSALAGPVLAWLASKRKITALVVLGAVLGGVLIVVSFAILAALTGVFQLALRGIKTEGPWGLAALSVLALAGLAFVAVRLIRDALADRRKPQPEHPTLDVLRIASAAIVVVYIAAIVLVAFIPGRAEVIEAITFMLISAVSGACLVAGPAMLTHAIKNRQQPTLDAGVNPT
jgi:hypothetical protein